LSFFPLTILPHQEEVFILKEILDKMPKNLMFMLGRVAALEQPKERIIDIEPDKIGKGASANPITVVSGHALQV
jgi:hypothetical protein